MKNSIKAGMMLLAGILLLTTSCDKTNDSGNENVGKGTVVLKLTDAPFPVSLVDQALVTIDKIEIRAAVSATATEDETNAALFTILYEGDGKEFDLLDLQNGVTAELLSMDIPSGSYDMLRMHVTKSTVILKDGTTFDLKVPSGSTSGIKVRISPELVVENGVQSEVILDFDVSKSFVVQGNAKAHKGIKGFLFKPVIRAMCHKYSGSIAGKVFVNETTPIEEAHVQIFRADTVYSSALTDKDGNYALIGLPAGTYKMLVEKDGYTAVTVDQVLVKAREKTVQDVQMVVVNPQE